VALSIPADPCTIMPCPRWPSAIGLRRWVFVGHLLALRLMVALRSGRQRRVAAGRASQVDHSGRYPIRCQNGAESGFTWE
jgi:hypothetical protein